MAFVAVLPMVGSMAAPLVGSLGTALGAGASGIGSALGGLGSTLGGLGGSLTGLLGKLGGGAGGLLSKLGGAAKGGYGGLDKLLGGMLPGGITPAQGGLGKLFTHFKGGGGLAGTPEGFGGKPWDSVYDAAAVGGEGSGEGGFLGGLFDKMKGVGGVVDNAMDAYDNSGIPKLIKARKKFGDWASEELYGPQRQIPPQALAHSQLGFPTQGGGGYGGGYGDRRGRLFGYYG